MKKETFDSVHGMTNKKAGSESFKKTTLLSQKREKKTEILLILAICVKGEKGKSFRVICFTYNENRKICHT